MASLNAIALRLLYFGFSVSFLYSLAGFGCGVREFGLLSVISTEPRLPMAGLDRFRIIELELVCFRSS